METKRKKIVKMKRIPMMPLRGLMIFPHMALHFDVGRPRSVAALEAAMIDEQRIFLVAQKDAETENPGQDDIYQVGTIAQIKQVLNLPGNSLRVLVEGIQRASLKRIVQEDPFWVASVQPIASSDAAQENVLQALMRTAQELFEEFARISSRVSEETLRSVNDVTEPDQLSDVIAANVLMRLEDRQAILEEAGVAPRLERLCEILAREIELAGIEKQVQAQQERYQRPAEVEGEAVRHPDVRREAARDDQHDEQYRLPVRQPQPVQHPLAHAEQYQRAGDEQQYEANGHRNTSERS